MRLLALILASNVWAACSGSSPTRTAADASQTEVAACVTAASDGDTILIPNGSSTWTTGISTTKQIIIRAQNYTPTSGGATSRNVTITNNSSTILFQMQSGNSFHVGLVGIRINEGTSVLNHIRFTGSGTKPPLVADMYIEINNRFGNEPDAGAIAWLALGGVMWNTRMIGVGGGIGGQCCPEGASFLINSPRSWTTASTMGSADTGGNVNVYVEDSTWKDFGQSPDLDDNARFVMRYSTLDGVSGLTHGFTSAFGGRHFEYYNNTFTSTTNNRNIAGRYFWARAGHGIFADNVCNNQNQGYGTPTLLDTIVEGGGTYPKDRQVGWGHNGTAYGIDPIYIQNQTGGCAYSWGTSSGTFIQADREVYANNGNKPGYTKYTYPHPLRAAIEGGGGSSYSRVRTGKVTSSGKKVSQ